MSACEPTRPMGKPGRRGTPVHHLGAGRVTALERRVAALETEIARLRDAIDWALGQSGTDEFPPRLYGDPPYWWRPGLRVRAFGGQADE